MKVAARCWARVLHPWHHRLFQVESPPPSCCICEQNLQLRFDHPRLDVQKNNPWGVWRICPLIFKNLSFKSFFVPAGRSTQDQSQYRQVYSGNVEFSASTSCLHLPVFNHLWAIRLVLFRRVIVKGIDRTAKVLLVFRLEIMNASHNKTVSTHIWPTAGAAGDPTLKPASKDTDVLRGWCWSSLSCRLLCHPPHTLPLIAVFSSSSLPFVPVLTPPQSGLFVN